MAACSTFLKLSPPPSPTPSPARPQLLAPETSDGPSQVRRKLCVAGAATIVVLGLWGGRDPTFPTRGARDSVPDKATAVALVKPGEGSRKGRGQRWSDSIQGCPPWRLNSLQVVVPENLPRPSFHRRWESVENPGPGAPSSSTAVTKPVVGGKPGCFSM
ncbi:hypothetical protein MLD38_006020 [Melastoma candidum]|uniref:Uncharacterized protein n=1 Tax=Melastoma candidum TaxID=119954 RepID=A0ACB9RNH2_9MYRT|nr:hypothetical protein MLD38_006020 [Melastoma candidum]